MPASAFRISRSTTRSRRALPMDKACTRRARIGRARVSKAACLSEPTPEPARAPSAAPRMRLPPVNREWAHLYDQAMRAFVADVETQRAMLEAAEPPTKRVTFKLSEIEDALPPPAMPPMLKRTHSEAEAGWVTELRSCLSPKRRLYPFFEARLLQQVRRTGSPELSSIPTDLSNYGEIAKVAIQHHGHALKWVPTDRADYGELAKLALQKKYRNALEYVPTDRADFGELAKLAVQKNFAALQHVPTDRTDYGELAKLAVQNYWRALEHVPTDRADYFELVKLALIHGVRGRNHDDYYYNIAKFAVQRDGEALQFVPNEVKDYVTIAKLAVQQNGMALQFVDKVYGKKKGPQLSADEYAAIALEAVKQNGMALKYAGKLKGDYRTVLAAVRTTPRAKVYAINELRTDDSVLFAAGGMKIRQP